MAELWTVSEEEAGEAVGAVYRAAVARIYYNIPDSDEIRSPGVDEQEAGRWTAASAATRAETSGVF